MGWRGGGNEERGMTGLPHLEWNENLRLTNIIDHSLKNRENPNEQKRHNCIMHRKNPRMIYRI